jgi:hypothetical protein
VKLAAPSVPNTTTARRTSARPLANLSPNSSAAVSSIVLSQESGALIAAPHARRASAGTMTVSRSRCSFRSFRQSTPSNSGSSVARMTLAGLPSSSSAAGHISGVSRNAKARSSMARTSGLGVTSGPYDGASGFNRRLAPRRLSTRQTRSSSLTFSPYTGANGAQITMAREAAGVSTGADTVKSAFSGSPTATRTNSASRHAPSCSS